MVTSGNIGNKVGTLVTKWEQGGNKVVSLVTSSNIGNIGNIVNKVGTSGNIGNKVVTK